ncbi:MAG: septum formation initiator family protein [Ruminococcaceae bacterium]|nr:septum formation initiator family protein [Oscillospiraceae bacterium]
MKIFGKKFEPTRQMLVFAAVAVLVVYAVIILIQQQSSINAKKDELAAIEAQIEAQKLQTEELEEILENNNDEYIIRMAREELDLVFPGERVYYAR